METTYEFRTLHQQLADHHGCKAKQLQCIRETMLQLLEVARTIVHDTDEARRADRWISHLTAALTNDRGRLRLSMATMQDTIDALERFCSICGEPGCHATADEFGRCERNGGAVKPSFRARIGDGEAGLR